MINPTESTGKDFEELADRETQLRAILESCVEGIITIDEQGVIESMNPSAERMFGYLQAETIGRNVKMLMPIPFHDQHDNDLDNDHRTGVKRTIGKGRDVFGQRKNGTTFPIHLTVSQVELSSRRIFAYFIHDLSERVAAENDLRRLAAIVEDSYDAITLQEFNGTIIDWNHGAERMYGYTADEAIGLSVLNIVPEGLRKESQAFRDKLASGDQLETLETQRITKDGRIIDVWITATVLHDQEGRPVAVATTERDVTDRKRIHEELERRVEERTRELREAHEQLIRKERLATLGQLAGGVAHEIRNPLGVIHNATYYLRQIADQHNQDVRDSFDEIQRALATSDHIVGELLDYARDPQSNHIPLPADSAIENAFAVTKIPDNIRVERSVPSNLYCIGDQGQVERILINLIVNAVQAMPHGGTLSLVCQGTPDTVSFKVTDTGVGIPSECLSKVFDPMFTRKATGIGLGLAISRRYAELNQGEIDVESTPNCGSTFRLSLPRLVRPSGAVSA